MRAALNSAVFFAALAATCAVIRSHQPFPAVAGVSEKWQHFERHGDDYEVLFVGSSRLFQHVIPQRFDTTVTQLSGGSMRSFNMAYLAMWPPESFRFARQILSRHPTRLRWVFIDLMNIPLHSHRDLMGRRAAWWHDWRHTLIACEVVGDLRAPFYRKWALWTEHASYLFNETTNRGQGAEKLALGFEPRKKRKAPGPAPEWWDTAGFLAEKRSSWLTGERLATYEREVAAQRQHFTRRPVSPALRRAATMLTNDARAAGVEPIFVVTPTTIPEEHFGDFDAGVRVWRFDDPNEYPGLYDPALHYDPTHLNEAGAEVFTDLLARRFAELGR